jgi:hypothetical protein
VEEMKKILLMAMVFGFLISACAGPHGGHGCMSTVNNWYKIERTRWQTSLEFVDCTKRVGMICNGVIFEDCMQRKGYIWVDGTENPRDANKPKPIPVVDSPKGPRYLGPGVDTGWGGK